MYTLKNLFAQFKLKQAEFEQTTTNPIIGYIDQLKTSEKLSEELIRQAIVTMLGKVDYGHFPIKVIEYMIKTLEKRDLSQLEKRILFLIKKHLREDKSHSKLWLDNDLKILKIEEFYDPPSVEIKISDKSSQELVGLCYSIIYGIEINAYSGFLAFAKLTENSQFNYKYFSKLHWQGEVNHSIYRYAEQDWGYVIADTEEHFKFLGEEMNKCNSEFYQPTYNRLSEYLKSHLTLPSSELKIFVRHC